MVRAKIGRKKPGRSPRCWCFTIYPGELLADPRFFQGHRWYNVPPDPSKLKKSTEVVQEFDVTQSDPENSRPLNFETFVPNHDPSLAQSSQPGYMRRTVFRLLPGSMLAATRPSTCALGAMYWNRILDCSLPRKSHVAPTGARFKCAHMSSRVMVMVILTETRRGSHMR